MTQADRLRVVMFGLLDLVLDGRPLAEALDRFPGWDPADLKARYLRLKRNGLGVDSREQRAAKLRRVVGRRPHKPGRGVTVAEMATRAGVLRGVMQAALVHAGHLKLVTLDGQRRRHLVTKEAEARALGHNADPRHIRSRRLDGHGRAEPFPVFAPEAVPSILADLDFDGLRAAAVAISSKRKRVQFLLDHAGHLPAGYLASLAGCAERSIERARQRQASGQNVGHGLCNGAAETYWSADKWHQIFQADLETAGAEQEIPGLDD